jgi:small subunit ribosomal protein S8e
MKKGKKLSGGKYIKSRKKKKYELPGQKRTVRLSEQEKRKSKRVMGGSKKTFLLRVKHVNILEKGAKKASKAVIKNVVETPSNRFLARQNIITKGTILETSAGKVRVTNRPSQEGVVNGILVKE